LTYSALTTPLDRSIELDVDRAAGELLRVFGVD
jgi:hypothetical protein